MNEPEGPGEPTLAYPDQVETVDVLGDKARAARERAIDSGEPPEPPERRLEIGRYQLLEMVGAGGMGVVWGAWDPELERRVALKLVRFTSEGSRERMLREGQVLARLSHPNVVPIFDVGVMGEQVYLVMEWIRGTTMRAYAAGKPALRALVAAYRQAGEGLAAAHRAGVIHRDFKPDNAIHGDDGRVRVLDFGLAHDASERGGLAGTPRYMPPEQARGDAVTAACDQYAFCVSVREALDGAGGVPGWIAAILERGAAPDPADRFDSMDELLAALARDPARRWRRGAIAVAAVAAAAGAFAVGRTGGEAEAIEPCSGAAAEVARSWNPALRDRVIAHLTALGPVAAGESERIAGDLDRYAAAWTDEHRRTCLANDRKELTLPLYEGRLTCLTRARAQLAAAGELMTTVDAPSLAPALLAARSLPDARGCAEAPGVVLPPPAGISERVKTITAQVERALVRATAQRTDAIGEAKTAATEARATGYTPLIARALLVEGRAVMVDRARDARALFAEARALALRASDDATAVEAYARWIFELARHGETAIDDWPVMVELAARLGRDGRFASALMYNNGSIARIAADDKAGARELLRTAQTIAGDTREIELVSIAQNLAELEPDPDECKRQLQDASARVLAALGAAHPQSLIARAKVGMLTRDLERARAEFEAVFLGLERWQQAAEITAVAYEAAWLADEAGDLRAASAWMKRTARDPDSGDYGRIAAAYVAIVDETPEHAQRLAELERFAATAPQTNLWERVALADAFVVIARSDPRAWERVVALHDAIDHPLYVRRRARARSKLAAHWLQSRPADARRLASLALPWYRGTPGEEPRVRELERISSDSR